MSDNNKREGTVQGVNGNMVAVEFETRVMQNEVAYVLSNGERLKSEVIRVRETALRSRSLKILSGFRLGIT